MPRRQGLAYWRCLNYVATRKRPTQRMAANISLWEGFMSQPFLSVFKGNNGKWSMMRVLCFIVIVGLIPVIYIKPETAVPVCSLMGVALGGKWLQKGSEPK